MTRIWKLLDAVEEESAEESVEEDEESEESEEEEPGMHITFVFCQTDRLVFPSLCTASFF
jgi:hypothetical protein